jgi:hypothetical protein
MSTTDRATTADSAKMLIAFCRAGKLYDIEKWIAAGKSLDISAATKRVRRRTLLEIAVETGFHSLVELIAKNEACQSAKDIALRDAVLSRRLDLVELLLDSGAEIKSLPLADVLLTWEPKLIQFFLDHGADPIAGRPFAEAFDAKVRTALGRFVEYKRAHPELATQLQEQLDCVLRHFCGEGDLKWVSLLIWAGGDPRSRGPCLGEPYTEDTECYTSGLEEACRSETPDVLRKLKPDRNQDDLASLLQSAAISNRKAILEYLLDIDANPNDKANGGSSVLDTALWHLSFARRDPSDARCLRSKYQFSDSLDCVRVLLEHGAVWNPNDQYQVNSLRMTLLESEPDVTIELLQIFRKHNACPAERVHSLLGTPRMEEHLKHQEHALLRLGIHLGVGRNASRSRRKSRSQLSPS